MCRETYDQSTIDLKLASVYMSYWGAEVFFFIGSNHLKSKKIMKAKAIENGADVKLLVETFYVKVKRWFHRTIF